jgi:hypothetical protein
MRQHPADDSGGHPPEIHPMSVIAFPVAPQAPKNEPTRYLGLAETNKLLRKQLAAAFPGVKFRVVGQSYSGGSSTDITWTDGPTSAQVEAIAGAYSCKGFDGSIDMAYCKTSWLLPDGRIVAGYSEGTEGSMGNREGYVFPKPHPQAQAVSTGVGYVFTRRSTTQAFESACLQAFERLADEDRCRLLNRMPRWSEDNMGRALASMIAAPACAG